MRGRANKRYLVLEDLGVDEAAAHGIVQLDHFARLRMRVDAVHVVEEAEVDGLVQGH